MESDLEGKSEMAEEPGGASDASRKKKRGASNTQADQQANAPDLAVERDVLWDASALSPAGSVPEADFSPGVYAALDHIFPAEQPRLGRVAERSAVYDAGGADGSGEGLEALADRYGVTLETLATRLDLSAEVLRAPSADCPPALLAEVAKALRAPMAEVALALRADDDREHAPGQDISFAERVRTAPSLTEEQRRRWLALLAAGPA
ncbi:MAG TPA: hypothetical protein VH393_00695 [Ktedonobacterales bacterium]|jgi:hypothetical protein